MPPRLRLSEFMADPRAVADDDGEWIELHNADSFPIDVTGWRLGDDDGERGTIHAPGLLPPGGYLVIARQPDPTRNGGISAAGSYTGVRLANEADELLLITPWGVVVDRVVWRADLHPIRPGASLERIDLAADAWATAHAPWPGSAGDLGSPGAAYAPPPTPTATPVDTALPTLPPTPPPTRTPTPTATPLPAAWPRRSHPAPLALDQVYPQGSDSEYVVIVNQSSAPVALDGWQISDRALPAAREGTRDLPADVWLAPGERWIAARNGDTFTVVWGRPPQAVWESGTADLPHLHGRGNLALADAGDELILLDPAGALADVLVWGNGDAAALGVTGAPRLGSQNALHRVPGAPYPTVTDLRHRVARLPPAPFAALSLPTGQPHAPVALADGYWALWGSLGAASSFSPDGALPPHLLLAAAGHQGLDFLAIADPDRAPTDFLTTDFLTTDFLTTNFLPTAHQSGALAIPAWRWQTPSGAHAVVYSPVAADLATWDDLLAFLSRHAALAQLPDDCAPLSAHTPLLTADDAGAPGDLADLQRCWRTTGVPLLPAGNSAPPLPGSVAIRPHYTGLAAAANEVNALLTALAARRGWLTSAPGLWLTLQSADGAWMGSSVPAGDQLTLTIRYGDLSGAPAGLALWQDDQIVRELDGPLSDGAWTVTLPAVPGRMLYAVATQVDGDFAVTAPLAVAAGPGGRVVINEALPAPAADHNGDGLVNTDDEYIELYNPGHAPLALGGYQLGDASSMGGGRFFTFAADQFINPGGYLLLRRATTRLSLNDDGDQLTLRDPSGQTVDGLAWGAQPRGPSISRIPDGGDWHFNTPPTPGQANRAPPPAPEPPRHNPDPPPIDPTNVGDPASPNFGQASGAPGSLALAKLRGLEAPVEFRAQVVVPPGRFPAVIYVAEPAQDAAGAPLPIAGLGVQVYLPQGDFLPLTSGDWVLVRGVVKSFRGEMEIRVSEPGQVWPVGPGTPLLPLPVTVAAIGEALEGRLVHLEGSVTGWQGDSLYLGDLADPAAPPVRVTVRASLSWRRPYVRLGEHYAVTGVVSQFARAAPWNDGYRVLVWEAADLTRRASAPRP